MHSTKTRIWHGGLREIMNEGGSSTPAGGAPTTSMAPAGGALPLPAEAKLIAVAEARLVADPEAPSARERATEAPWVERDDAAAEGGLAPLSDVALDEHARAHASPCHTQRFGWWTEPPRKAAAPSLFTTTRIMPIEQLIAPHEEGSDAGSHVQAGAARALRRSATTAAGALALLRRTILRERTLRTLLVAALFAASAGVWSTHRSSRQAHAAQSAAVMKDVPSATTRPPPAADGAQAVAGGSPATGRAASDAAEREPAFSQPATAPEPEPEHAQTPPASGLERAAVDALAAGDYARAQHLYEELARGSAEPSIFMRAAHILAERTASSGREHK